MKFLHMKNSGASKLKEKISEETAKKEMTNVSFEI